METKKSYAGGCHCGKVKYDVTTDLGMVLSCNCSICSKKGALLTFVPMSDFTLHSGGDALKDYQFNKHIIHHLFCGTCGVQSFARAKHPKTGQDMVAVNVRCLDGVDPDALKITPHDGLSA